MRDSLIDKVINTEVTLSQRAFKQLKLHIYNRSLPPQWIDIISLGMIDEDLYEISDVELYLIDRKDVSIDLRTYDKHILYSLLLSKNCDNSTNFCMIWNDLLSFTVESPIIFQMYMYLPCESLRVI